MSLARELPRSWVVFAIALVGALAIAGSVPAAEGPHVLGPGSIDDGPAIHVLSNRADGVDLEFTLPALAIEDLSAGGETFQGLAIPHGGESGDVGQPMLPIFGRLLQIPDRADVQVAATVEQTDEYTGVRVIPVQDDQGPFAYDLATYSRDSFGDTPVVKAGGPALLRGMRVVPVTFSPVQYNPAQGKIRVARRIHVSVSFAGENLVNAGHADSRPIPPSFDRIYQSLIMNYQGGEREIQPGAWLIICPNDNTVVNDLQALVAWRQRRGLPAVLATTQQTGTTNTEIKAYIQNAYDTWNPPPEYVVLAGDASGTYNIPTWYESLSGYGGEGDHPYVQLDGGDVLPDAHIGRLSFNSLTELETIVAKIVGYESAPYMTDNTWFTRACLVGDPTSSGYSCVQVMQSIKERLRQVGYTQVDTVFGGSFVSQMTTALNRGDTIFSYRGYLGMSGWSNSATYGLTNGWKLPFCAISTCGTGSFASETSVSEGFLRAGTPTSPKGGIAATGTATWGTHTRYNNCFIMGMLGGMFYEDDFNVGAAFTRAKLEMYLNYWNSSQQNYVTIYCYWQNLMGDPATECWTGVPAPITATYPAGVPVGTNSITVSVSQLSTPVPDAEVCLWKGSETYARGTTDALGRCELPVNLPTAGNVLVTITKHNCQPVQGTIQVTSSPRFVAYRASTINDDNVPPSQGNGDGVIDAGETIELAVQVRNYGTQAVSGVTATLSSQNPYVTVVNGSASFGNIAAGASAWGLTSYVFRVAPDCPHGTNLRFSLDVTSGADQWHSLIDLPAVSAELTYSGLHWYAAGGNGLLDPGETVGLSIALENVGGMNATAPSADLSSLSLYVDVPSGHAAYPDINAGGTGENVLAHFTVHASSDCYNGFQAPMKLVMTFSGGARDTVLFTIPVGVRTSVDPTGPDAYGYIGFDDTDAAYPDHPTYSWVELDPAYGGGGTEIVLGDGGDNQDKSRVVDMPFHFQYYGGDYTQATVCSNGWVVMGQTYLQNYRNWTIPSLGGPSGIIAVFWDDLYQDASSKAFQYYDAGNHRWIVEWSRFKNFYNGATETFEAIFYDPAYYPVTSGDGMMDFQYNTISNPDATDGYATVGVERPDNQDGVLYTYFNAYTPGSTTLAAGRAIRFLPLIPTPTGTVQGTVSNGSYGNAPIAGASVAVLQTGRIFTTTEDGTYEGHAPAGTYTLVASRAGFLPDTVSGVVIVDQHATTQDFSLTDIAGPEITDVTRIGRTPDTTGPYPVEATVVDYSSVSAVRLYYRVNFGPWQYVPMTGDQGVYGGGIPGLPAGSQVDYYVWAQDGIGQTSVDPPGAPGSFYTFYITEILYTYQAEDPEDPNWVLGVAGDDADTGIWIRDDPVGTTYSGQVIQTEDDHTPDPGVKCFVTGNGTPGGDAGENDVDHGCTTLMSPVFDLSQTSQAFVDYWRWYAMGGNSMDDVFDVDVSSDGGANWVALERVSDNENYWTEFAADLTQFITLTDQVVFRFVACDLNTQGLVEAAIDDFSIESFTPDLTGVGAGSEPAVFRLYPCRPNPSSSQASITFSLEKAGPATLTVYDVQGRVLRRLVDGPRPAGTQTILWDGRTDIGAKAPSGLYFYRLEANGRSQVRKMMRIG